VLHTSLMVFGLYDERRLEEPDAVRASGSSARASWAGFRSSCFPLASSTGSVRPISVGYFVTVAVVTLAALRVAGLAGGRAISGAAIRNVLIVGSGPRAQRLYRELYAHAEDAVQIYGFVDTNPDPIAEEIATA